MFQKTKDFKDEEDQLVWQKFDRFTFQPLLRLMDGRFLELFYGNHPGLTPTQMMRPEQGQHLVPLCPPTDFNVSWTSQDKRDIYGQHLCGSTYPGTKVVICSAHGAVSHTGPCRASGRSSDCGLGKKEKHADEVHVMFL